MAVLTSTYNNVDQTGDGYKEWMNINNVADGTSGTYCYVNLTDGDFFTQFSEQLWVYGHNIDTTRSDYITKVEVGVKLSINNQLNTIDSTSLTTIFEFIGYNNVKSYLYSNS